MTPIHRCTNFTGFCWSTVAWIPSDAIVWLDTTAPEVPRSAFYHVGTFPPASIADRVWEDLDGNGRQDAGEPGISDLTVYLNGSDFDGNNVARTTSTDANGAYAFAHLQPGQYQVAFPAPPHFMFTQRNVFIAGEDNDSDADPNAT